MVSRGASATVAAWSAREGQRASRSGGVAVGVGVAGSVGEEGPGDFLCLGFGFCPGLEPGLGLSLGCSRSSPLTDRP